MILACTARNRQADNTLYACRNSDRCRVRQTGALAEAEDLSLDLIHVFGHQTWGLGAELARMTGARLVLEVWGAVLLPATGRAPGSGGARRGVEVPGPGAGVGGPALGGPPAFMVPGRALAHAVNRHAPLAGVHVAPWGVPVAEPARPVPGHDPQGAIAATVFASGDDTHAVLAALEGLRDVGAAEIGGGGGVPQLLGFLDSQAAGRPQI